MREDQEECCRFHHCLGNTKKDPEMLWIGKVFMISFLKYQMFNPLQFYSFTASLLHCSNVSALECENLELKGTYFTYWTDNCRI